MNQRNEWWLGHFQISTLPGAPPSTVLCGCATWLRLQDKIGPQKVRIPSRHNLLDDVTAFHIRLGRDQRADGETAQGIADGKRRFCGIFPRPWLWMRAAPRCVPFLLAVKSAKYFAGFGIDTLHLYNFRFPIQIPYGRKQTHCLCLMIRDVSILMSQSYPVEIHF